MTVALSADVALDHNRGIDPSLAPNFIAGPDLLWCFLWTCLVLFTARHSTYRIRNEAFMGVIKEGTISGNFPRTEAFAVHYPGYPSSTTRAIETLGGSEGILKARCLQSNKLELHFRPEDPYSHPVFGELQPCNNFLLRISKRKERNGQNTEDFDNVSKCVSEDEIHISRISCPQSVKTDQVNESRSASTSLPAEVEAQSPQEVQDDLSANIVSRISEAYHFNGMVDYQHVLSVHADVARRKKRNWADMEPQFEKGGLMDVDQEDLMILVPPLFSIKDVPEKVIPKKVSWEKYIPEKSEQWEWQMAVCKLFDEHPIWVKSSLAERLLDDGVQFGDHTLRRLLFRAAYYFSNGPFLRFWIRKGYDPRKDPESRIYQRIDFRVPPSLRSYDVTVATGLKHRWEDICSFRVFPYKYQTSLQLFELVDDYIQQEIRKPSQQATCSVRFSGDDGGREIQVEPLVTEKSRKFKKRVGSLDKFKGLTMATVQEFRCEKRPGAGHNLPVSECATGWFPSSVLDSLRLCITVRFLSVYPKAGAESLLKSASERFNKSKRTQIYTKDKRLDEEIQQANAAIDNDNISKNYLQELFGSFPFGGVDGHGLQDADNSDGEYPIYEQFSEGNFSDDDDY
ncbi:hypothetical protein RHSIM_Rhsim09G0003800 [Rhododendron simsii]|uniref:General transcription factor 3C polypeptide 5 n=1 Tax=Rhododendron simsii TaxID=118357 RepID=A0A834LGH2_RHOSS|nr:hypothetical protein RHSIM_Rhsim09G0003800 [Rhododendron simsii]